MTNPILEQACGQWSFILESAGVDESYLKNKHGPCPMCGGKDRFRFDDKNGRGTYICSQCGAGNGMTFLMRYCDWQDSKKAIDFINRTLNGRGVQSIGDILKNNSIVQQAYTKQANPEAQRKKINIIWSQSTPITHSDPVDRYLQARGINLEVYPPCLRYHSDLPYYDNEKEKVIGHFPAMIALIQNQSGETVTLHRTYLGDACKANVRNPKKLMSPAIPRSSLGAAIRLYPPTGDGTLAIAEGIETALAFYIMTGIPVWATVSALGMERIILPSQINKIWIAVDNDHSGTGQKAADALAARLVLNGQAVRCVIPPKVGDDFADLLLEENNEQL